MCTLVCSNCGSENVQIRVWYNPNTQEVAYDCNDGDAWCDNCECECSLEQAKDFLKNKYVVIKWPRIQHYMVDGFEENAVLINDEKGLDHFGSSAYFVNAEWALPMLKKSPCIDSLYVYVGFPESQPLEELDDFKDNAYVSLENYGWYVKCEWLNEKAKK